MSVRHVHAGPEKHLRSLRAGVLDGSKPPYEGRSSVTPLSLFPPPCRTAGIFQTPNKKTFHLFPLPFHPIKLSLSFQPVKIFSDPNSVTECILSGAFRKGFLGSGFFFGGGGGRTFGEHPCSEPSLPISPVVSLGLLSHLSEGRADFAICHKGSRTAEPRQEC